MKMTTEEAFVKVPSDARCGTRFRHHRFSHDAYIRSVSKGRHYILGVVQRESGLRSSRRVTHAFVFDAPDYDKLLLMADCVINIMPDLAMKRDIVQNAVDLARTLGVVRPEVAVLAAVEVVNPGMPATIDAAALSKMAERGQIQNAHVDGPLAFDVAISSAAATIKGLGSRNAPDILIVPNIDAGNMLYK